MKHSIRKKITLVFVALIALLVGGMFVLYSFFLLKVYRNAKLNTLRNAYKTVNEAVTSSEEEGESLLESLKEDYDRNAQDSGAISMLRNLSERSNIDVIMMNSTGTMVAATSRESEWNLLKLKAYISFDQVFGDSEDPFFPIFGDTGDGGASDDNNGDAAFGSGADNSTDTQLPSVGAGSGDSGSNASADNNESFNDSNDIISDSGKEADDNLSFEKKDNKSIKKKDKHSPMIEVIERNQNYTIQLFNDRRSNSGYIECWGQFSDGDTYFLMTMPISSMEEGVNISRVFLAGLSAVIIGLGCFAVYFATGLITKPIIDLTDISERMSKLDFSAKYTGKQKDEIGQLGESMNSMSEKLEETINELKAANAKLQEDIDIKTKIDEARKEFIADVSHELKTPIAIIEGYAEGLVEGVAEDKETRDYYSGIIMDEAGKMNKLVKQLTSLINYEFGDNTNACTVFDLSELVQSVIDAQKMRLKDAGAVISTELIKDANVNADEFKMEEVFTNYLNNAINHLEGEHHINVRIEPDGENWKLSVYNDGTPIPEESIPKLWDKFYKVDKSRSRQYGGSGIGLSIVKAIMESHGGKYGVRNLESGVEFYIEIKKHLDA